MAIAGRAYTRALRAGTDPPSRGRFLDEALQKARVDRKDVYITNAVKHFSWEDLARLRGDQSSLKD
jgi:hypothetical protein